MRFSFKCPRRSTDGADGLRLDAGVKVAGRNLDAWMTNFNAAFYFNAGFLSFVSLVCRLRSGKKEYGRREERS